MAKQDYHRQLMSLEWMRFFFEMGAEIVDTKCSHQSSDYGPYRLREFLVGGNKVLVPIDRISACDQEITQILLDQRARRMANLNV